MTRTYRHIRKQRAETTMIISNSQVKLKDCTVQRWDIVSIKRDSNVSKHKTMLKSMSLQCYQERSSWKAILESTHFKNTNEMLRCFKVIGGGQMGRDVEETDWL